MAISRKSCGYHGEFLWILIAASGTTNYTVDISRCQWDSAYVPMFAMEFGDSEHHLLTTLNIWYVLILYSPTCQEWQLLILRKRGSGNAGRWNF